MCFQNVHTRSTVRRNQPEKRNGRLLTQNNVLLSVLKTISSLNFLWILWFYMGHCTYSLRLLQFHIYAKHFILRSEDPCSVLLAQYVSVVRML